MSGSGDKTVRVWCGMRQMKLVQDAQAVRAEIAEIEAGRMPHDDNVLKNAPHTAAYAISALTVTVTVAAHRRVRNLPSPVPSP